MNQQQHEDLQNCHDFAARQINRAFKLGKVEGIEEYRKTLRRRLQKLRQRENDRSANCETSLFPDLDSLLETVIGFTEKEKEK